MKFLQRKFIIAAMKSLNAHYQYNALLPSASSNNFLHTSSPSRLPGEYEWQVRRFHLTNVLLMDSNHFCCRMQKAPMRS
jgi:hypothetical protein